MKPQIKSIWAVYDSGDGVCFQSFLSGEDAAEEYAAQVNYQVDQGHKSFSLVGRAKVARYDLVLDVVDFNGNKVGETYDCGEPGCCTFDEDDNEHS